MERFVPAIFQIPEDIIHFRMRDRIAGLVHQKILLGNVGGIMGLLVLSEEMVVGLILLRANFLRNRLPPFIGMIKGRIDIENHTTEGKESVANNLSDSKFGLAIKHPAVTLDTRSALFNAPRPLISGVFLAVGEAIDFPAG